jgi:hypothetical protein
MVRASATLHGYVTRTGTRAGRGWASAGCLSESEPHAARPGGAVHPLFDLGAQLAPVLAALGAAAPAPTWPDHAAAALPGAGDVPEGKEPADHALVATPAVKSPPSARVGQVGKGRVRKCEYTYP